MEACLATYKTENAANAGASHNNCATTNFFVKVDPCVLLSIDDPTYVTSVEFPIRDTSATYA